MNAVPRKRTERQMARRTGSSRTIARLKLTMMKAGGNKCAHCAGEFLSFQMDLDHAIPIALGGTDDDDAFQLLCKSCHYMKTTIDVKVIAAARRLQYIDGHRIWVDREFLRHFYLINFREVRNIPYRSLGLNPAFHDQHEKVLE